MRGSSPQNLGPGVILATALALLEVPLLEMQKVRLLVDPGSEVSLISVDIDTRLKMSKRSTKTFITK